MVTTLLFLTLNAFVLHQHGRPLRDPPIITSPSGISAFAYRNGMLTADAASRDRFHVWLKSQGLSAVANQDLLPTVVARGTPAALARYGRVENTLAPGLYRVQLGPGIVDPQDVAARMLRDPNVTSAEPDEWWVFERREALNDPFYGNQWHLHNSNDTGASPGSHVRAEEAWNTSKGNGTIIAVGDDGFSMVHPDLVPQYVEGAAYDFVDSDADPSPHAGDGHGTRVLGTAAARGGNGIGGTGVCPECRAVPMRLFTSNGESYDENKLLGSASVVADAFRYAAGKGARIINSSWGPSFQVTSPTYRGPPSFVVDAIVELTKKNVLFVWAAGNQHGFVVSYDGWAGDPRVLAVGAINARSEIAQSTVMGAPLALLAPSADAGGSLPKIVTTDLDDGYSFSFTGTSAASPVAAGVAGLVLGAFPSLTVAQLIEVLLDSAQRVDVAHASYSRSGESCTHGAGRIDARAAIDLASARQAQYASGFTVHYELCGDGVDNDNNPATADDSGACLRCIPTAAHEVLGNSIDDDCDGNVDNTIVCVPAGKLRCDMCAASSECQVDFACIDRGTEGKRCLRDCAVDTRCAPGESCQSGVCLPLYAGQPVECSVLSTCTPTGAETCDGLDNDCNGKVDDLAATQEEAILAQARCVEGAVGVCTGRTAQCQGVAGWACFPAKDYRPQDNTCDGVDNNCDGTPDDTAMNCAAPIPEVPPKKSGCAASDPGQLWPLLLLALLI